MKNKTYILYFLILICSCQKSVKLPQGSNFVLEIGKYNLTLDELQERIEKVIDHTGNRNDLNKNFQLAWDASVRIGLILADAYKNKLDTIPKMGYLQLRDEIKGMLMMPPAKIYNDINSKDVKNAWSRRNRYYRIGHIICDRKDHRQFDVLAKKINEDDGYLERIITAKPDYNDSIAFAELIKIYYITGGDLLPDIEKEVYKMNIGDIIRLKTKNRLHLIRLYGIMERKQEPYENSIIEILKNRIAKTIMYEEKEKEGDIKILIDKNYLDEIDKADNYIIAKINGIKVTFGELKNLHKELLSRLGPVNSEVQNSNVFNNIVILLDFNKLKKNGNDEKFVRKIKRINEQYMFQEYYKAFISTREPVIQEYYERVRLNEEYVNSINEAKVNFVIDKLKEKYKIKINKGLLSEARFPIQGIEIKSIN